MLRNTLIGAKKFNINIAKPRTLSPNFSFLLNGFNQYRQTSTLTFERDNLIQARGSNSLALQIKDTEVSIQFVWSNSFEDQKNNGKLTALWQEKLELYKKYLSQGKDFYDKSELGLAIESFDNILSDAVNLLKKEPQLLADAYTYKGMVLMYKGIEKRMEDEKMLEEALKICPTHELAKDRLKSCLSGRFASGHKIRIESYPEVTDSQQEVVRCNETKPKL